jgi:hypothetical protein
MTKFRILSPAVICWATTVTAEINTGGLHYMRSPDLVMEQQNISINPNQVSVSYVLNNTSKSDITETIVSPIPTNISVDDQSVEYKTTNRAIAKSGQDISNILKHLGVPFDPITAMHSIDVSPNRDNIRSKLIALKIIDKKDETPEWFEKKFYYWQQKFPAGSQIKITQSYKPNLISKSVKLKSNPGLLNLPFTAVKKLYNLTVNWTLEDQLSVKTIQASIEKYNPQIKDFCPNLKDYQLIMGLQEKLNTNKTSVETKELVYNYLADDLWSIPINHFSLKIQGSDDMHPMLCWAGDFKHQGKNTLVFEAENYIPLQNLKVLFVEK